VYAADAAETLSDTAHAKFNSYERSMRSKRGSLSETITILADGHVLMETTSDVEK